MSPRVGPESAEQETAGPSDANAFTAMFENHAAHVFDYCSQLLGDEEAAAAATETALIAAKGVLQDPERLRAWLFALARECMSQLAEPAMRTGGEPDEGSTSAPRGPDSWVQVGQRHVGDDPAEAKTERLSLAEIAAHAEREAAASASMSPDRAREIFELVYRHGIRPDHLPVVLGVSPDRARALLAAAVAAYGSKSAMSPETGAAVPGRAAPDEIASKPLAPLPPSVRRRTFQAVFGAEPISYEQAAEPASAASADGGGSETFDRARKRLLIAGIAALPAAAAVAVILYLAGSSGPHATAASRQPAVTASPLSSVSTSVADPATSPKRHKQRQLFRSPTRAILPVTGQQPPGTGTGQPTPAPTQRSSTPRPKPTKISTLSPSPSPHSSPPPISASPSPSPSSSPGGSSSSPASSPSSSATSAGQGSGTSGISSLTAMLPLAGPSAPALSIWLVAQ